MHCLFFNTYLKSFCYLFFSLNAERTVFIVIYRSQNQTRHHAPRSRKQPYKARCRAPLRTNAAGSSVCRTTEACRSAMSDNRPALYNRKGRFFRTIWRERARSRCEFRFPRRIFDRKLNVIDRRRIVSCRQSRFTTGW